MPKVCNVNNTFNGSLSINGHQVPYLALKTCKKGAGWTVPKSSDGLTYNGSGDQITGSGTGAGGLSNNHAWWINEEPGGRRQWCYQVGNASAGNVRIKYSAAAKFVGGTPGATRVPSAADEQVLVGSGTDAAPGYVSLFQSGAMTRYHIVAFTSPISGAYAFYLWTTAVGSAGQSYGLIFQEPMLPGTFAASDGDPVVVHASSNSSGPASYSQAWFGYGTPGQVWSGYGTVSYNQGPFNGTVGGDLGSNQDVSGRPWWYATIASAVRAKGCSAILASKGPARTYPATLNRATDAYVYLGNFLYPYPENTEPSIA